MTWRLLIDIPWMAFVLYWTISALNTKTTEKRESFAARYGIMFLEVVGFVFLFKDSAGIGFLGHRVIPRSFGIDAIAVVLTWVGIALAIWARWHLGQYWSGRITIKERSQVDPHGPVRALATSDLFRAGPGGDRFCSCDWPLALPCGSLHNHWGFLDQGEKGRSIAGQEVRGGFRGAPPADGIFVS